MKIKVSEASGPVLDWIVAKCEGQFDRSPHTGNGANFLRLRKANCKKTGVLFSSTDPAQAYPIIEREEIGTKRRAPCMKGEEWEATGSITAKGAGYRYATGPTPLIAAMRCLVASKLGDTVDVPEELCQK